MNKKTFWNLISEHKILIPKIQRDYAQGRNDNKTTRIRKGFLDKIFECLESDTVLKLDFIYGSIDKKGNFIPLDGQQRLTTLFLLCYYLALRSGENGIYAFKNTKGFTYETRFSSNEFIVKLINNMSENLIGKNPKKHIGGNPSNYISDNIKNQHWFFNEYLQDPTIKGMLVMLDDIEEKCYDMQKNLSEIFENLCNENECKISFEFLDLKDYNFTDELYIKMNARGKPLSDFENFKAKFIERIEDFGDKNEIENSLDNEWLDMFWTFGKDYENNEVEKTDDKFLAFFHAVLVNLCRETLNTIEIKNLENISAVDFLDNLDASKVEKIKIMLDNLSTLCKNHKENTLLKHFKIIINEADGEDDNGEKSRGKISAYDREKFYIDMLILSSKLFEADDYKSSNFAKFQRVGYNIANNRYIRKTSEFISVLDCIDELFKGVECENFYDFVADEFNFKLGDNEEIREEKDKAALIIKDTKWENVIYKAESHWYLNGQIGFLLDFCCDAEKFDINKCDLEKFKLYSSAFEKCFPQKHKDNEQEYNQDIIFRQALLTKGVYFEIGYVYNQFYDFNYGLRSKIDTWRKAVLRRDDDKGKGKSHLLKALLDDVKNDKTLLDIINDYSAPKIDFSKDAQIKDRQEWTYFLVKHKEMWGYYLWLKNYDSQNVNNLNLTLKQSTNNAVEYYTYALYLELGIESKYETSDANDSGKIGIKLDDNKLLVWQNDEKEKGGHFYAIEPNQSQENGENNQNCICCDSDKIGANQTGMTTEKFNKAKFWLENKLSKCSQ